MFTSSSPTQPINQIKNNKYRHAAQVYACTNDPVLDTKPLYSPYSAPSHPNPNRGLQPVFCRCRGNRQLLPAFYRIFTDIFYREWIFFRYGEQSCDFHGTTARGLSGKRFVCGQFNLSFAVPEVLFSNFLARSCDCYVWFFVCFGGVFGLC